MPEPTGAPTQETGFVPGSGAETVLPSAETAGENPVIQHGRDFMAAQMERVGIIGPPEETEDSSTESQETTENEAQTSTKGEAPKPKAETSANQAVEETTSQTEPEKLVLTQQELERRVQAETDRRLALQAKKLEREQKQERLRRLRDSGDSEGFAAEHAAQEREEEAENSVVELRKQSLTEASIHYDGTVLDPIVNRLEKTEIDSLIQSLNPVGVAGRAKILAATVDLLEKKAEARGAERAEKALRNNEAFRKQILLEGRDTEEEPDLAVSAGRGSRPPTDMNQFIDNMLGRRRN